MKNILLFFGIVSVVLVLIFVLFQNQNKLSVKSAKTEGMILFYSTTCPHCQKVEEFIKQNKVEEKVKFQQIEVNSSPENANLFIEKASICGISQEKMGVPLYWDGSKCISGDQGIVDYFKSKIK